MKPLGLAALVVIALSLFLSAAKDVGWIGENEAPAVPSYRVIPIPQGRMLILFDVHTGETWHASMKAPEAWEKIADGPPVEWPQDDPPSDVSSSEE